MSDRAPGAYERLVDRLLASPAYGERWGRHWLDVVRYADSNGLDENVAHGNAWRYRDYVISAFNADKPYSRFVQEQLAGDLLPAKNLDEKNRHSIATGFLSLGPKVLAEVDETKMEMDIVDEQIDTFGKAFLGLTLGCARCHDHKFDPITHEDYYALAGIFKSTKTMDSFTKIAKWHEHEIATADQRQRKLESDQQIKAKIERDRGFGERREPIAVDQHGRRRQAPRQAGRALSRGNQTAAQRVAGGTGRDPKSRPGDAHRDGRRRRPDRQRSGASAGQPFVAGKNRAPAVSRRC